MTRWIPVFAVFLLVDLYLGQAYWETSKNVAKQENLLAGSVQAVNKAGVLQRDAQQIENELVTAKADLSQQEAAFLARVDSLEIFNLVVASAQASGVQLNSVQQMPQATEKLPGNSYQLDKQRVTATGRFVSLGLLMNQIENKLRPTWRIAAVSFTPSGDEWKIPFDILTLARPQ